jgi:hypothetical protein
MMSPKALVKLPAAYTVTSPARARLEADNKASAANSLKQEKGRLVMAMGLQMGRVLINHVV